MKRINLLPKLKQRELVHERLFYSVAVTATLGVVLLLLSVLVQVGVWTYLDRSIGMMDTQIEELKVLANKSENAVVKKDILLVNAQLDDFTKLSSQTPKWSSVISKFIQHVPEGVKITQFTTDLKTNDITISGYSPTRDLVIDLYNNVNSDKDNFKSIDYPLENVTQPIDVRFSFTMTVAEGILIGGAK